MVGAAISVATARCELELVREMLTNPELGWPGGKITPAQPRGLFLARVEYRPEAMELATDDYEKMYKLEKVNYDSSREQDDSDRIVSNGSGSGDTTDRSDNIVIGGTDKLGFPR